MLQGVKGALEDIVPQLLFFLLGGDLRKAGQASIGQVL